MNVDKRAPAGPVAIRLDLPLTLRTFEGFGAGHRDVAFDRLAATALPAGLREGQ